MERTEIMLRFNRVYLGDSLLSQTEIETNSTGSLICICAKAFELTDL